MKPFAHAIAGGLLLALLAAPAAAQQVGQPVTPRACAVTVVTTGGTAVTAFSGPANGFALENPTTATEPLFWSLPGAAVGSETVATFGLAPGASILWTTPLQSGVSLSVNATTSAHAFSCARW